MERILLVCRFAESECQRCMLEGQQWKNSTSRMDEVLAQDLVQKQALIKRLVSGFPIFSYGISGPCSSDESIGFTAQETDTVL